MASVYAEADEATKRSYNQAFFSKLYILPEWDEQTVVLVARAELTETYALLLAENFAEDVQAEAESITAQAAQRTPKSRRSPGSFASGCSYFVKLAGMAGRLSKSPWPLIQGLHNERFGALARQKQGV